MSINSIIAAYRYEMTAMRRQPMDISQIIGGENQPEFPDRLPAAAAAATTAAFTPSAAAATVAAASAAAATAGRFGPGFVHVQRSAVELGSVQLRNRVLGVALLRHFDESETTRLARIAVRHDVYAFHVAKLRKGSMQIFLRRLIAEITDKNVAHEKWGPWGSIESERLLRCQRGPTLRVRSKRRGRRLTYMCILI